MAHGASADRRGGDSPDGEHVVTYRAVDLAGNESPEHSLHLRVDRTPPELVVFEQQVANDPRQVVVTATDRTSGVASGVIELRRVNASDDGWHVLATSRRGDRFVGSVPDESFARGVYELRARVVDAAGNVAIGDRRRDGSLARVDTATLRASTKLTAGLRQAGQDRSSRAGGLVGKLTVAYGKGASVHGTLITSRGVAIAGAPVSVYARPAAAGAVFKLVGRVRTSQVGAFDYRASAGPSRILRFRYAGSPRNHASQADVALRVKAAATIRSDRKSVRNGDAVSFKGRLLGRPIPASGKVLDLQAFYRGKWRTFATPRASSRSGSWSYHYRFGATRGRVLYKFRLKIRSESAYPYATGYSNVIKVVVTG